MELQIAIVGPLTSLALGGLFLLLLWLIGHGNSPLAALLGYLGITNLLLGVFNLIPGFPLDGGRVLRAIIWKLSGSVLKATRVAAFVGQLIAYLLILVGIWMIISGDFFDGLWFGFIGWFLLSGAQSANTQATLEAMFKGISVGQVMNRNPATVPANISLQKLVEELFLPYGWRSAFVVQGDQLAGLITLSDIRHTPREAWAQTPVGFAMTPVEKLHTVSPQQSFNEVLPLMATQDINQVPVVSNGQLVGTLSREDIIRSVEIRRGLGMMQKGA